MDQTESKQCSPQEVNARLRWVEDEDCYDDSYIDTWEEETEETRQKARDRVWALIESQGVWIRIAEVRCPHCGSWDIVDSVGGMVGQDVDDYDEDMKASAEQTARQTLVWEETDGSTLPKVQRQS